MQAERRLSQKLINYWHSLKEFCEDTPNETDVSAELLSDIWSHCFLIKQGVKGNPLGYRYCFMGDALTSECMNASPDTRRFLERILQLHNATALEAEKVLNANAPIEDYGHYYDKESNQMFLYRRCFVPLKDKEGEISAVLGGFRWKTTPYEVTIH